MNGSSNQSSNERITPSDRGSERIGLDLSFRNVSYTVGSGKRTKRILQEMSGIFQSGKLSAIMGPSGAGKTSLMNILAGLRSSGVEGKVEIDGVERNLKHFRKQSAYITQQDHLLKHLTVYEYLEGAAHLKIGNRVPNKEKKLTVENVMRTLNLADCSDTRVCYLSGGERKRLSIALELVNNPSILFLDEPTSGLDSSSSMQCVKLLQEIARSGRTVIATIHQPSSRLLEHFDHLYIVADGSCMYQGPVSSLVPFLEAENLICPSYHNPADFVMDLATEEDHGHVLKKLISNVGNGRLVYPGETGKALQIPTVSLADTAYEEDGEDSNMLNGRRFSGGSSSTASDKRFYGAPFHSQVAVLLKRTWLSIWREHMLTLLRFAAHVVVGILMGLLYWQIGDDAAVIYNNAGLLFFNQLFVLFAAMMPTIVTFPLERDVLVREQLNHWYSLKAYYLAKTLADIPFQFIFPAIYLVIVYCMTNQPLDILRFLMLLSITICMALVAQGIGLLVGAAFSIPVAVFAGPAGAIPFLLFSGFFVNMNAIPAYMHWILYISFMRYSFEGSMVAIYSFDRPPLSCSQPYCHFRYADKFLAQFDMEESSFMWCTIALIICFVVIRILGYLVLRFKLRHVRC